MKVAYLLPGFVRNFDNINEIEKFIVLNNEHTIDFYTNTYNVLGSEFKEPSNKRGYADSVRIDENFTEGRFPFKKIDIQDYDTVDKEVTQFAEDYKHLVRSSVEWDQWNSQVMRSNEDVKSRLRVTYAQWRNVHEVFNLIDDPDQYDMVVKSRYDAFVSRLVLSDYKIDKDEKSVYGLREIGGMSSFRLDNGDVINPCMDFVVLGNPKSMEYYCRHGERETFIGLLEDENLSSKEFSNFYHQCDIKLCGELPHVYRMVNIGKYTFKEMDPKHFPEGRKLTRKQKFPT